MGDAPGRRLGSWRRRRAIRRTGRMRKNVGDGGWRWWWTTRIVAHPMTPPRTTISTVSKRRFGWRSPRSRARTKYRRIVSKMDGNSSDSSESNLLPSVQQRVESGASGSCWWCWRRRRRRCLEKERIPCRRPRKQAAIARPSQPPAKPSTFPTTVQRAPVSKASVATYLYMYPLAICPSIGTALPHFPHSCLVGDTCSSSEP